MKKLLNKRQTAEKISTSKRTLDRKRAAELNAEVLLLGQERDALYDRYDKLSTEVAGLKRRDAAGKKELSALRAQIGKLKVQLAAEQKEHDRLTRELTDLKAKRRALDGAKAPQ